MLIEESALEASHTRWHAENPTAPRSQCHRCRQKRQREDDRAAKFVSALVREGATPPVTIQELAHAVERRPSWIRRILHEAELTAPEAVREPLLPRSKRPCARCGHLRHCHCSGAQPRLHVQTHAGDRHFPLPMTSSLQGDNRNIGWAIHELHM